MLRNYTCWNCFRNQGGGWRRAVKGVNSSMINFIHCKNLCKHYNVPPPSTTIKWKNKFYLFIFITYESNNKFLNLKRQEWLEQSSAFLWNASIINACLVFQSLLMQSQVTMTLVVLNAEESYSILFYWAGWRKNF
jgi:hypothetical protein